MSQSDTARQSPNSDPIDPAIQPPLEPSALRIFWLVLLVIVYAFNFLDRQILGILAIPIQKEMGISDFQLGLMRGASFALLYSVLGVPIAWLADRVNRVWIIATGLTIWSGMTALCGVAQNVPQLFLARIGVGIGEAAGVAPSYSIVADYFPPQQRARALAAYSLGIPLGSAIGIVFGGVVATLFDWRTAFIAVGLAGVIFAPLFLLLMREPVRGRFEANGTKTQMRASFGEVLSVLIRKPTFWCLAVGAGCASMMGYGTAAWIPAFLVRSHGPQLADALSFLPDFLIPAGAGPILYAAYFFGLIALFGGFLGIWFGGLLADFFGRSSKRAFALVPGIAFVICIPMLAGAILTHSLWLFCALLILQTGLGLAWLGPLIAAFQQIVPISMRATTTAMFLLINNLIGLGLGDPVIGFISDQYELIFAEESLRYAILTGGIFYAVAGILMYLGSRSIERDWHRA